MPLEQIQAALRLAMEALAPKVSESIPIGTFFPIGPGIQPNVPKEVAVLVDSIRASHELQAVTNGIFFLPGASVPAGAEALSRWLASHAMKFGCETAVQHLQRYVAAETITSKCVITITGLKLSGPCVIDATTTLLPFEDLEETEKKFTVKLRSVDQMRFPTAALVREIQTKKVYLQGEEIAAQPPQLIDFARENTDILLCAGLFGPTGPSFDSTWFELPDWVPTLGGSYSYAAMQYLPPAKNWPEDAYSVFPGFYRTFQALNSKRKAQLRIAVERLNASMHPTSLSNAAIDCRVALESLFLTDEQKDRGELKYRLRLRAARFLASNNADRRGIFDLAGRLYDLGSIAVHTGLVDESNFGSATKELLSSGQALISRAIRKSIETDRPDWVEIELG
jgi:hypothetical protein